MRSTKELAGQFVEAFNKHDEKALLALDAPDATFAAPGGVALKGREASTGYAMAWLNAFPDARMLIRNEITTNDTIVQEFTFEGTHTATLHAPTGDLPATNKRPDHQSPGRACHRHPAVLRSGGYPHTARADASRSLDPLTRRPPHLRYVDRSRNRSLSSARAT